MNETQKFPITQKAIINGERLWHSLMQMATIGAIPGNGSCRLSLSDEDKAGRDLFAGWCQEAGLKLTVDRHGNMFAVREGRSADAPCILIGSHLDTQPHGGRFDGVLGVLAGLELLRSYNDAGIETDCAVVVVNWTNEEGVRFKPGLTGSAGFAGTLDEDTVIGIDGTDFFSELQRIGYAGKTDFKRSIGAYYELHIEQGPVLERANQPIGVVEGIQGVRWYEVLITGQDAHAGTTPIQNRQDSFMAAAALATELRLQALSLDPDLRFTIGCIEVSPNSTNTVPGQTKLTIDLRHGDTETLDTFEIKMAAAVSQIDRKEGVKTSSRRVMDVPPAHFDEAMKQRLYDNAIRLCAEPVLRLPSGAMHDASSLAKSIPTAMIFVQSRNGISHNPAEWSEPDHIRMACEVLAQTVLEHASGK